MFDIDITILLFSCVWEAIALTHVKATCEVRLLNHCFTIDCDPIVLSQKKTVPNQFQLEPTVTISICWMQQLCSVFGTIDFFTEPRRLVQLVSKLQLLDA